MGLTSYLTAGFILDGDGPMATFFFGFYWAAFYPLLFPFFNPLPNAPQKPGRHRFAGPQTPYPDVALGITIAPLPLQPGPGGRAPLNAAHAGGGAVNSAGCRVSGCTN